MNKEQFVKQCTNDEHVSKDSMKRAMDECISIGLYPRLRPLGEHGHHTGVDLSEEDKRIGDALAYFMGTNFCDEIETCEEDCNCYFYRKLTSVDEWSRIARALRIHGLRISNVGEAD